ncbi:MAG: CRISPR-associated helicase Cas3' [Telmatospirillum sp.]|nr:CRISPR-associated helicase Cas3' [Telmatospirillum sp.]
MNRSPMPRAATSGRGPCRAGLTFDVTAAGNGAIVTAVVSCPGSPGLVTSSDSAAGHRHARAGKFSPETGEWKLLLHHMLDVAAVLWTGFARRPELLAFLAQGLGMCVEDARAMLILLAALHDAGKVATSFQALNPTIAVTLGLPLDLTARYSGRGAHGSLGWAMMLKLVRDGRVALPTDSPLRADVGARLLFAVVCGHHGRPPQGSWRDRLRQAESTTAREFLDRDLDALVWHVDTLNTLFRWDHGRPDGNGLKRLSFLINGIVTLCDWIGSTSHFQIANPPPDAEAYWTDCALPSAEKALDAFHPAPFSKPARRPPESFATLFPGIPHPTPLQARVDALFTADCLPSGPLLAVIEDMTGSGKTEAGDLIAQRLVGLGRADGVYVGLPTMATADAAFIRRFGDETGRVPLDDALFSEPAQVMLAHSKRRRGRAFRTADTFAGVEDGEAHAVDWLARSSRLALAADLGVGTVDQALAGAISGRFATLRLSGLWRKVLLIDEVHAYDDYMRVLLAGLLRHHAMMGGSAVLMSATLPAAIRGELIRAYADGAGWTVPPEARDAPYPLLTLLHAGGGERHAVAAAPGFGHRPVRFEAIPTEDEVDRRVVAWIRDGRSVVWFRNTVGDAVGTWRRLCDVLSSMGLAEPLLYHARFVPRDRAEAERRLLEVAGKQAATGARRGRLVISTQAAEQSLDLDFDELASDMAPADVLFQRLGRRRRHARDQSGMLLAPGEADHRGDSSVLLHVPPHQPVDHGWHGGLSWGARQIYADPGVLWHTASELLGRKAVVPTRDIRSIMEAVFGSPPPDALAPASARAQGDNLAEAQQGRSVAIDFQADLVDGWRNSPVEDEDGTPRTRLGEGHSIVIGVIRENAVSFLVSDDDPVAASECRCPIPLAPMDEQSGLKEALIAGLPPGRRKAANQKTFLFLTSRDENGYRGTAMSRRDSVDVTYTGKEGLMIGRREKD